ncbi:MAG: ABC transporter permease [Longimicrobiales bacterium]
MDTIGQDIRYALRRLRQNPGFSTIVVLTLALGIGANTAIFSVVNAILLRPLPYHEPTELVTIEHVYPSLNLEAPVSARGFRAYRDDTKSFEALAVQTGWQVNLTGAGEPERLTGARVSGDFFRVFGVNAVRGRTLRPDEDVPGQNRVVVLSDGLWRRLYGAQPDMVGQTMQLNGEPFEIVGVMPAGFRDYWNRRVELWTPLALAADAFNGGNEFLSVSARLKAGTTLRAAASEMRTFAEQIKRDRPDNYPDNWTLSVTTLNEQATGNIRPALLVLLGAVGFVLLIACANVANLLLARAAGRTKEIAVRAALGAARVRILRQLLTESVMLGLSGGALGLLLAYGGVRLIAGLDARNVPFASDVRIDAPVLIFTLAIALITGLIFGAVPALQASRADVQDTLRSETRGTTSGRSNHLIRGGLVVTEVALALTLLVGAGLLIKSFGRLSNVNPGFDTNHLLTFNISLPRVKYANDTTRIAFWDRVIEELKTVPGVSAVGATSVLPFGGGWSTGSFQIEGYQVPENTPGPWGDIRSASADFATALRLPLRKGRFLNEADRLGSAPVVVIDEEFVRRYFPDSDPIGRRITFNGDAENPNYITIVGVVGHAAHEGLDAEHRIQLYFSYRHNVGGGLTFALRTAGNPSALVSAVRTAVKRVDADQPISGVATMDELVAASLGQRRLSMTLLALFATLAIVLASLGIYGVTSQLVTQRQRELGVRMALGAGTAQVMRLVLVHGMGLTMLGVAAGAAGSFALTRVIQRQLFDVAATDPSTFVSVAVLLSAVAFVATVLPAWRAARLDPLNVLRQD